MTSDLAKLDTQDVEVLKENAVTGKEEDKVEGNEKKENEKKGKRKMRQFQMMTWSTF